VGVSLGLATCIIDQSSSKKYWDSICFQVTYFQIVPMLLLLLEASVYTSNFLFLQATKIGKIDIHNLSTCLFNFFEIENKLIHNYHRRVKKFNV
jgi:hypothetical protein